MNWNTCILIGCYYRVLNFHWLKFSLKIYTPGVKAKFSVSLFWFLSDTSMWLSMSLQLLNAQPANRFVFLLCACLPPCPFFSVFLFTSRCWFFPFALPTPSFFLIFIFCSCLCFSCPFYCYRRLFSGVDDYNCKQNEEQPVHFPFVRILVLSFSPSPLLVVFSLCSFYPLPCFLFWFSFLFLSVTFLPISIVWFL